MLDVVHYFLDEDIRYSTADEMTLHSNFRTRIFGDLYEMPYRYGISEGQNKDNDYSDIKPYIPPTEVDPDSSNPFGSLLDAPLS